MRILFVLKHLNIVGRYIGFVFQWLDLKIHDCFDSPKIYCGKCRSIGVRNPTACVWQFLPVPNTRVGFLNLNLTQ